MKFLSVWRSVLLLSLVALLLPNTTFALSVFDGNVVRRDLFQSIAAGAALSVAGWTSGKQEAHAIIDASLPFCVIGANGRTGTKCVSQLLEAKFPVRATSRSGIYIDDESGANPLLLPMKCDVTDPTTVEAVVKGSRAVIFAASASKQGGTPAQVDNEGLVTVAKACIANRIPHLVVISSGGVSKPDSPVYKFLNLFGGIMEQKIQGEDLVRSMYSKVEDGSSTYTIIRPGGLTEEPPLGATGLELNQGDLKSGRISRYDVASLSIQSTFYPKLTGGTTFECYNADTGKSLGTVGFSNLTKQKSNAADLVTGKERRGETWEALFSGLETA